MAHVRSVSGTLRLLTVLVVEDAERLAASLVKGLGEDGFVVEAVGTAREALARVAMGDLRAVILDLGLPDRDGQEVIVEMRKQSEIPILVLTARDAVDERVKALDSGADDFLIKPFAFAELLARLRAALRRAQPTIKRRVRAGDIELLTGEPSVLIAGHSIRLSPRERALLEMFLSHLGEVVGRRDILREAFGYDFEPGTNIVEVHVGHLRRKIASSHLSIETVRGYGYRARESK